MAAGAHCSHPELSTLVRAALSPYVLLMSEMFCPKCFGYE
jgi:hypothetical protein